MWAVPACVARAAKESWEILVLWQPLSPKTSCKGSYSRSGPPRPKPVVDVRPCHARTPTDDRRRRWPKRAPRLTSILECLFQFSWSSSTSPTSRRDRAPRPRGRAGLAAGPAGPGRPPARRPGPRRRRATIRALEGLEPQPWTAAWGAQADRFAARARARHAPRRGATRGCRPTAPRFWAATRRPTIPSRRAVRPRPRVLHRGDALEDPPLEVVDLPFDGRSRRGSARRPST